MKKADFSSLTVEELQQKLLSEKEHLQKLKFAHAISPIENPMQIRVAKRNIARILTQLNIGERQNG